MLYVPLLFIAHWGYECNFANITRTVLMLLLFRCIRGACWPGDCNVCARAFVCSVGRCTCVISRMHNAKLARVQLIQYYHFVLYGSIRLANNYVFDTRCTLSQRWRTRHIHPLHMYTTKCQYMHTEQHRATDQQHLCCLSVCVCV